MELLSFRDCKLPWASYQIRKIAGCACAGNAGNIFPHRRFRSKSLVSDPGMHHGTCVTHVPWCMSGSLIRSDGENVPGIPGACAPAILRIWQEAHTDAGKPVLLAIIDWHFIQLKLVTIRKLILTFCLTSVMLSPSWSKPRWGYLTSNCVDPKHICS